jgi:hypothetical protein
MKDADKRDELIRDMADTISWMGMSKTALADVADYVLAREKRLKEEYEKKLDSIKTWCGVLSGLSKDERAVAFVHEKDVKIDRLEQTIADMVGILKEAKSHYIPHDPILVHPMEAGCPILCKAIDQAIRRGTENG